MRTYTPGDIELFARYEAHRADLRPKACNPEGPCWVRQGPPAFDGRGGNVSLCRGCEGRILGKSARPPIGDPHEGWRAER